MTSKPAPVLALLTALAASPAVAQTVLPVPPGPPETVRPGRLGGFAETLMDPSTRTFCGEDRVEPVEPVSLAPALMSQTFQNQIGQRSGEAVLLFRIDETGRPIDIRASPVEQNGANSVLTEITSARAQASLAGSRFAAGARSDCRLIVTYRPVSIAAADASLLARFYGEARTTGPAREAVEARLAGDGADCGERRRSLRGERPDFEIGAPRQGRQEWTVVRWNIDEAGQARDAETLASSGDAAFDAETRRSTEALQVVPGKANRGCVYNWFRRGATLPAPPMPAPPPDPLTDCPAAVLASWRAGEQGWATPFLERGIEGWALVRFDIAPWGEVGNVAVIGAQPAAALGEAAAVAVRNGRAEAGAGGVRCIQPVIFRIPPAR